MQRTIKVVPFLAVTVILLLSIHAMAKGGPPYECTVIQDGNLLNTEGMEISTGFDEWGYNYQARIFNGSYCDAYANAEWCQDDVDTRLIMKWNDSWLSRKDCDFDGILDRHYGYDSYIGSGAWLVNHQSGSYYDSSGEQCHWTYSIKIVAVPADAYEYNGYWFTFEDEEIGAVIWGQFATVQLISNDTCVGSQGVRYLSPVGPGLGKYK